MEILFLGDLMNDIEMYINFVIKPLEDFRNKLIYEKKISYDDNLIKKIEDDIFQKYKKLEKMIDKL